jgi:pyruvate dehydrogenase E1 component
MATIIRDGLKRMYGGPAPEGLQGDATGESIFYYLTLYNENYAMPPRPAELTDDDITSGLYRWSPVPEGVDSSAPRATLLFSGSAQGAAREAQAELAEHYSVGLELWSATSYKRLREEGLSVERWNRLHPGEPARTAPVTDKLTASTGPIVAVTDFMKAVPDQIARFVPPGRRFLPLGTDGFGRSDTREALRRFFETDTGHVVVAVLSELAADEKVDPAVVKDAIARYDLDPDVGDPITR